MALFCSTVRATVVLVNKAVTVTDGSVKLLVSSHVEVVVTGALVRVILSVLSMNFEGLVVMFYCFNLKNTVEVVEVSKEQCSLSNASISV